MTPARLAKVLVGLTFFLIFWGGQVTTTLSGDSVPAWPSSFFVPKDMPQVWELGHRWIAGTVGLVAIALCISTLRADRRPLPRKLTIAAAVLVVVQALVGGVRVLMGEEHSNVWPVVHAMLAQGFLATVVATSVALLPVSPHAGAPGVRGRGFALAVMAWVQAVLGAVLRHETQDKNPWGLFLHIGGAFLVIVFAVRLIAAIKEEHPGDRRFQIPSHLVAAALVAQLALGLAAWTTTHTASGYVNPTDVRSLIPTIHLVVGSGVIALGMLVGMRARGLKDA
jgi:heme A synthase